MNFKNCWWCGKKTESALIFSTRKIKPCCYSCYQKHLYLNTFALKNNQFTFQKKKPYHFPKDFFKKGGNPDRIDLENEIREINEIVRKKKKSLSFMLKDKSIAQNHKEAHRNLLNFKSNNY